MSNQVIFVLFPQDSRPKYKCSHGLDPVLIYHVDEDECYLSCGQTDCQPSRDFLARCEYIAFDTPERMNEFSKRLKASGLGHPVYENN